MTKSRSQGRLSAVSYALAVLLGAVGASGHEATEFDGIDDVIDFGVIDHNHPITYSVWLKPTDTSGNRIALGRYYSGYMLGVKNSYYIFNMYIDGTNYVRTPTTATEGEWAHMAATYDGTTVTYYLDAGAEAAVNVGGDLSKTDRPWQIGANGDNAGFFQGYIDTNTVHVYNRALSAEEIWEIYRREMDPLVTRYNGAPAGPLPPGTTSVTMSLNTMTNATARYSLIPGTPYDDMTNTFANTGGTSHWTIVTNLSDGNVYRHCVRCRDESGHTNTDDYEIAFSVGLMAYYVDGTNGNDRNDGLSPTTAWKTIAKANEMLSPGLTAFLMAGTYGEAISPVNSGAPGSPVTYSRYADDDVILTGMHTGVNLNDRSYVVIDGLNVLEVAVHWVSMDNSTYNVMKRCFFEKQSLGAGIWMGNGANHNKILDNTLIGLCGPNDLINCQADCNYNLFEGNNFVGGAHIALQFQGRNGSVCYNVIRNNTFSNKWHTGLAVYTDADYTIVEGNVITDSGEDHTNNVCGTEGDRTLARQFHPGIQFGSSHCIIRNNILINNGIGLVLSSGEITHSLYNRVYHNTFYGNCYAHYSNTASPVYGNVLKNNAFCASLTHEVRRCLTAVSNDNYYINNNIYGSSILYDPDGIVTLTYLQSNYPALWYDNMEHSPGFAGVPTRDLQLLWESPMIDSGTWLTTTASAGSGSSIELVDARYFTDGYGVVEGDRIRLEGRLGHLRIVTVDYESNVIVVDKDTSWNDAQGVALVYERKGGAPIYGVPDIGALEYQPPFAMGTDDVDIAGNVRVYADGKFRNTATPCGTAARLSVSPSAGFLSGDYRQWMDLGIETWEVIDKKWTESSAVTGHVLHVIGGLLPETSYDVKVNGVLGAGVSGGTGAVVSDTDGTVSFTYTGGYSTVTLEMATSDDDALPDGWETNFFGDLAQTDTNDPDRDGSANLAEYGADTNPTNSLSLLTFTAIAADGESVTANWKGGTQAWQYLEYQDALGVVSGLWCIIFSNPSPTDITNSHTDTDATNALRFYRVRAVRE